jgi:peroxiredoxin (alkyl hydroperoxide reductase subunit C)
LGISVDSQFANKAFAEQIGVTFPILSDWQRTVTKQYGIFNEERQAANRYTFVIDKQGMVQHIDKDREAIDPSGAHAACSLLEHKKQQ